MKEIDLLGRDGSLKNSLGSCNPSLLSFCLCNRDIKDPVVQP